jgi:hypothetical protein
MIALLGLLTVTVLLAVIITRVMSPLVAHSWNWTLMNN